VDAPGERETSSLEGCRCEGEIQRRHGGEGFEVSQDSTNWNVEENRGGPKSFMQRRRALLESRMLGSLIPES
jgi:hypothetical protein